MSGDLAEANGLQYKIFEREMREMDRCFMDHVLAVSGKATLFYKESFKGNTLYPFLSLSLSLSPSLSIFCSLYPSLCLSISLSLFNFLTLSLTAQFNSITQFRYIESECSSLRWMGDVQCSNSKYATASEHSRCGFNFVCILQSLFLSLLSLSPTLSLRLSFSLSLTLSLSLSPFCISASISAPLDVLYRSCYS